MTLKDEIQAENVDKIIQTHYHLDLFLQQPMMMQWFWVIKSSLKKIWPTFNQKKLAGTDHLNIS
jgi:ribonuclease BN (tRNA processing enzyme)